MIEKVVKLIVHTESTSGSTNGSIYITKGYIFFPNAYYYGDIAQQKANGYGNLYYPNELYQIEGLWDYGSLKKGTIYKRSPYEDRR